MLGSGLRILVVEDDRGIADTVIYALKTEGFRPEWAATGTAALAAVRRETPALVLLDLGLPDVQGFELLREIRAHGRIPVIVVTARNETIDRVTGLEMGADDYVPKPFSPREVTARVRAVLRRCKGCGSTLDRGAECGVPASVWSHDEGGCRIAYGGTLLDLTRYEYRLLAFLLASPGRVFSRDQLMERVWDDPGASFDRTVDAHVKTLRAKLRTAGAAQDPILTHRGMGYSLRAETR